MEMRRDRRTKVLWRTTGGLTYEASRAFIESARHDALCAEIKAVEGTPFVLEGCGVRVSYTTATHDGRTQVVLTARVAITDSGVSPADGVAGRDGAPEPDGGPARACTGPTCIR